ncbi:MAG: hypothetical protein HY719_15400, partial [Planctomycetes bacterium]|nr:hypothetical protein [Planctomycetota bacterium]
MPQPRRRTTSPPPNREAIIAALAGARVGVVGDLIADLYLSARPMRLSREAPVLIVRHEGERLVPGGAGNTAANIAALGARVTLISLVGDDAAGAALRDLFRRSGIHAAGLVSPPGYATVTKTRLMVGEVHRAKQQVIRIDREPDNRPPPTAERALARAFDSAAPELDAVVISDYGYDVVGPALMARLRRFARSRVVVADSRYRPLAFAGVTALKQNEEELARAVGSPWPGEFNRDAAAALVMKRLRLRACLATLGNQGMSLYRPRLPRVDIPAHGADEVVDVTGAGDTVSAVFTTALATGADFESAARLANLAAGITVLKPGA